jgi:exodeoxyribonuclease VII large subunit
MLKRLNDVKGIGLRQFLNRVKPHINSIDIQTFNYNEKIIADVTSITTAMSGNTFLEFFERQSDGSSVKMRGVLWHQNKKASSVLTKFHDANGKPLSKDMKIIISSDSLSFYPTTGQISFVINDIDTDYDYATNTAKTKAIKETLIKQEIFYNNKNLPLPVDAFKVGVISPEDGQGLGDFKKIIGSLDHNLICRFGYISAPFMTNQTSSQIIQAIKKLIERQANIIIIIRGGGDDSSFYFLNDQHIAEAICYCPVPVLSGIGHEVNHTIIDEVVNRKFATPSQVASEIKDLIKKRALKAQHNWEMINQRVENILLRTHKIIDTSYRTIEKERDQKYHKITSYADKHYHQLERKASQLTEPARDQVKNQFNKLFSLLGNKLFDIELELQKNLNIASQGSLRIIEIANNDVSSCFVDIKSNLKHTIELSENHTRESYTSLDKKINKFTSTHEIKINQQYQDTRMSISNSIQPMMTKIHRNYLASMTHSKSILEVISKQLDNQLQKIDQGILLIQQQEAAKRKHRKQIIWITIIFTLVIILLISLLS